MCPCGPEGVSPPCAGWGSLHSRPKFAFPTVRRGLRVCPITNCVAGRLVPFVRASDPQPLGSYSVLNFLSVLRPSRALHVVFV